MEIRKSSSSILNVVQENKSSKTEKKSDKSLATGIASTKDSFEVSSTSNQENSGTKQLGAAQQQEASKSNFGNDGTSSQNSRPTYEDAKNSGLAARLGHNKETSEADSKKQLPDGVTVADLKNSAGQAEQSSAAVKDAQQKLNGGSTNYRDALDQEVARRRQDVTAHGGSSAIDRALGSRPDLAAAPKGKTEVPTGKDQLAYAVDSQRKNKDGTTTTIHDETGSLDGTVYVWHSEHTYDIKTGKIFSVEKETAYRSDNTKIEKDTQRLSDNKGNYKSTTTTTTTKQDGTVTVNTSTTTKNKDGPTTTNTTETTTPPGGSKKMPGIDDRGSDNIPDDIKKSIDYDMQQLRNAKPKSGGETELTDGGVTGNSADGSVPINNAFTRTGGVMGAVAQPTRAGEYVGGPSNGTVGSAVQNGGATDSLDGSSWTGTTHQDDPADVQFGPNTPVAEGSVDSKKADKDTDNSTSSVLGGTLNRKSKKSES